MYEKKNNKTRDPRSFIEIWASLPEIGKTMLVNKSMEYGLSKQTMFLWAQRGSSPILKSCRILQKCLSELWGLQTAPESLFPDKSIRKALAERYKEQIRRKGTPMEVNWPSLQNEDNEDDTPESN